MNKLFGKKRGNEVYQAQQSRNKQQEQYDRLVDAATNSKYSKMRYRDAVKAGAPKLAPLFGEHISKRMNYGTALRKSYISGKGKRAKRIAKGL